MTRHHHKPAKRPRALVKALCDSETQSDYLKMLRASGILPRRPVSGERDDADRRIPDPRSRRFGQF